ncbi:hypothetical protein FD754_019819 [Muntiacus muntjak]|uniref:COMM domain-containing protein 6 n=1 Tax=Muntiacus muntjak TaxID=9888 RepID=A0A5N3V194_MUNMU|nr:hypothetical protein FD754_019819 [Muntiacus muntjak]
MRVQSLGQEDPLEKGMAGCIYPVLLYVMETLSNQKTISWKLIDFQWKLGMAVSSDSCRSLKYPYVAVMLKVADHSGQVKNKSFEMTIPQFQEFLLTALPTLKKSNNLRKATMMNEMEITWAFVFFTKFQDNSHMHLDFKK